MVTQKSTCDDGYIKSVLLCNWLPNMKIIAFFANLEKLIKRPAGIRPRRLEGCVQCSQITAADLQRSAYPTISGKYWRHMQHES
jgi:hypothetical protein